MLEAVNSVLQTSSLIRGNAEQVSTADSFAANPDQVQKVAQAPYVSPYIHVDTNGAVLQIRDGDTGDVLDQYPSESRLKAQAQAEAARVATSSVEQKKHEAAPVEHNDVASYTKISQPQPQPVSTPQPQASAQQLAAFDAASQAASTESSGVELLA